MASDLAAAGMLIERVARSGASLSKGGPSKSPPRLPQEAHPGVETAEGPLAGPLLQACGGYARGPGPSTRDGPPVRGRAG